MIKKFSRSFKRQIRRSLRKTRSLRKRGGMFKPKQNQPLTPKEIRIIRAKVRIPPKSGPARGPYRR